MTEVLLTSSALILALLLLRQLFRHSISQRLQYGLWGLVLLRLLLPAAQLPQGDFGLLAAAEPAVRQAESQVLYLQPYREEIWSPMEISPLARTSRSKDAALGPASSDGTYTYTDQNGVSHRTEYRRQIALADLLRPVWQGGMALTAFGFFTANFCFWRKLRRNRRPYFVEGVSRRVYLVEEGLPSPCLFGLFRPAVYLTPAAAASPETLRHVLAHEETHARHQDPLWALLRCVCLTVYWFDPLVWLAAIVSRTDCELACDEGALLRLEEGERIPYGRTLLSLIPVQRVPANPLLTATTMTAGKRQLKDRIRRIADRRRPLKTAVQAMALLAAALCAVTFSRAKDPSAQLTQEELDWFNSEFFNGETFNIRNQFLVPLYETAEEIDLFQLFYNGTGPLPGSDDPAERQAALDFYQEYFGSGAKDLTAGAPGEAERQAAAAALGGDPGLDLTRCFEADMNTVLRQHTGLSLDETQGTGLEQFIHLPEYPAYYHFHSDTNYRPAIQVFYGERTGDGQILLDYKDAGAPTGYFQVTLRERGGSYQFVSNRSTSAPALRALPEGEPALRISLGELPPYAAPAAEQRSGVPYTKILDSASIPNQKPLAVCVTQGEDGRLYFSVHSLLLSSWPASYFLTAPDGDYQLTPFAYVLGKSGVEITYRSDGQTVHDFYTFGKDGTPSLLVRAPGEVQTLDLDGDGEREIVSPSALYLWQERTVYEADLRALLEAAWPEASYMDLGFWNEEYLCLPIAAQVPLEGHEGLTGTALGTLHFDGGALLLYQNRLRFTDRIADGIDAPAEVLDRARKFVEAQAEQLPGMLDESGEATPVTLLCDDWRISSLSGPYEFNLGPMYLKIWRLDYQLHTPSPERVVLAGGRYLTEDGWVSPGYPNSDYLVFQLQEDEGLRYIGSQMCNDCAPGSDQFTADIVWWLEEDLGRLTLDHLEGSLLVTLSTPNVTRLANRLAEYPVLRRNAALRSMAKTIRLGRDPENFPAQVWSFDGTLTEGGRETLDLLLESIAEEYFGLALQQADEAAGE